jgi:hypothetical protein
MCLHSPFLELFLQYVYLRLICTALPRGGVATALGSVAFKAAAICQHLGALRQALVLGYHKLSYSSPHAAIVGVLRDGIILGCYLEI